MRKKLDNISQFYSCVFLYELHLEKKKKKEGQRRALQSLAITKSKKIFQIKRENFIMAAAAANPVCFLVETHFLIKIYKRAV